MKALRKALPLRTAVIYAVFGILWILLSDKVLNIFVPTPAVYSVWQSIKGGFFVLVSAGLIYLIISSYFNSLQESEHYIAYQAGLLQDVSDALIATDMQHKITFWNNAAEKMYGWNVEEVFGRRLDDFFQTEYTQGEDEEQALQSLLKSGHWKAEVTQRRKDGSRLPVMSSVALVRDEDGNIAGMVAVNRDITERKQAEQALHAANDLLEERVKERTEELHAANLALEKTAKLKDEFLAGMSHELRTPLNAVISLSEAMQEGIYGDLSPKQKKTLGMIGESGNHLLELINDILDLAKIEAGKFELQYEIISLSDICQSAMRMVNEIAKRKGLETTIAIADDIPPLHADGRRLKQMLVNLLSNAVKFTPQGGSVNLEVARENRNAVRFTVLDTGIGIPPEQLDQLFKPFTQLEGALSKKYGGTGLGLALVRELAEMHNGSAGVESVPGNGSRFYFILPLAAPHKEAETESAARQTEAVFHPKRTLPTNAIVLLVDDNQNSLTVTGDYLTNKGYHIVTAENGIDAIEQAEIHHPHLIIMDIQMPGLNGLDAIRRIRAKPEFASVPIIALTALAMPGDRERCLEAGANAYLAKPASLKGLAALMEELLQQ